MKVKNFTITSANLQTGSIQLINDVPLTETVTPPQNNDNNPIIFYYPKQLLIRNNTGCEIGFNAFSSNEEYAEYQRDTTNFQLIRIPNNISYECYLHKTEKIIVQKISGTASSNLIVQCMNYRR
jgi:hypothetical protein